MRRLVVLLCFISSFVLTSCNELSDLQDLTQFSTDKKGDYLLFNFITPFTEDGYIWKVNKKGESITKYSITDKHFAPSDVFYYTGEYYFASGAYSNDSKVVRYNPKNRKMSLIDTNQEKYIEKFYSDKYSKYITTSMDKDFNNEFCDVEMNKCIEYSDGYRAHDVTSLDNSVVVVGIEKDAGGNKKNVLKITKYNRSLEVLKEVMLDQYPNYFTYTSQNNKLYLFMCDGDIVEIDSDLNLNSFSFDLSTFSEEILYVEYNKNVMIDKNNILVNVKIQTTNKTTNFIAKISFENDMPKLEIIENTMNEDILNVDYENNEIYTRSYVDDRTVITIWDTNTLEITNKIVLTTKDPIYFVDNIN